MSNNSNTRILFANNTAYSSLDAIFKILKEGLIPIMTGRTHTDFTFWTNYSKPSLRKEEEQNYLFPELLPETLYDYLIERKMGRDAYLKITPQEKLALKPIVFEEYKASKLINDTDLTKKFKTDKNQVNISVEQIFENNVNRSWLGYTANVPEFKKKILSDTFFDLTSHQNYFKYNVGIVLYSSDDMELVTMANKIYSKFPFDKAIYLPEFYPLKLRIENEFLILPKFVHNLDSDEKLMRRLSDMSNGNIIMDRDLGTGELNSLFVKFYSIPMIKMSSIENVAGDGKIKITFEFALALPEKFSLDVAMSIDDMKGISFVEKAITLTTIKEKINNDCYNYILTRIEDDYALKQLAIIVCSTNEKYKPYLETVKTAQLESLIKIPEIYTEMRTEIKQTLESYYQASDNSKMVELFASFEPALANEIPFSRMYDEKVAIPGILKFEEEYLVKYQTDLGLTNDDITAIRTQEKQFFIDSTALTTSELEVIVPFLNQDRLLKTLTIESKFPSENDNSLLLAAESANANVAYNDNWIVVRRMMFDNVERDNIEKIYLTDMYLVNLLNSDKITNGLAKIDIIRQNGSKIDDYSIEFDGEKGKYFVKINELNITDLFIQLNFLEKEIV